MPTVYQLKSGFQGLLRPLTNRLAQAGISANEVTLAALAGSVAVGAAVAVFPGARWPLLLVGPFLFVRMALNAIDGMIAREHDQKSRLGMVLNEAGDIASDAALYLPLAYVLPGHPAWVTVVVLGAALTETVGILGQALGGDRQYQGPMGKSDRALWFGLVTFGVGMQWIPTTGPWEWGWGALIVLTVLTLWNRGRAVLRESGGSDDPA